MFGIDEKTIVLLWCLNNFSMEYIEYGNSNCTHYIE